MKTIKVTDGAKAEKLTKGCEVIETSPVEVQFYEHNKQVSVSLAKLAQKKPFQWLSLNNCTPLVRETVLIAYVICTWIVMICGKYLSCRTFKLEGLSNCYPETDIPIWPRSSIFTPTCSTFLPGRGSIRTYDKIFSTEMPIGK